jgi:hypothetical protein
MNRRSIARNPAALAVAARARSDDHRVMLRAAPGVTLAAALLLAAAPARAAAPFVYRGIVLPRGDVALDLGLGFGHAPDGGMGDRSSNGFGMNLEVAGGVAHELELGLRTGFRFDGDGQSTQADGYGRLYETETFGTGKDRVANPELRLRWAVARGAVAQIGLEGRVYMPFESGTRLGFMFDVPLALRLGSVRIDTGLYVPILFTEPRTTTGISIPIHVWIQASPTFWLGPLFGFRVMNPGGQESLPFGFGIGSSVHRVIDLRAWFLFPHLNGDQAARTFGAGGALQIRFE